MTAQKPDFPEPQLIREDFLPEPNMKRNYRIKKVTWKDKCRYYPQVKRLGLFWMNVFVCEPYSDGGYTTFEFAQEVLCDYLKKPVVEYLDVNCGETK
jgi:hypothetical protein